MKYSLFVLLLLLSFNSSSATQSVNTYFEFRNLISSYCDSQRYLASYKASNKAHVELKIDFTCPSKLRFQWLNQKKSFEFVTNQNEAWLLFSKKTNTYYHAEHYTRPRNHFIGLALELFKKTGIKLPSLKNLAEKSLQEMDLKLHSLSSRKENIFTITPSKKLIPEIQLIYKSFKPLPEVIHIKSQTNKLHFKLERKTLTQAKKAAARNYTPDIRKVPSIQRYK